MAIRTKNQQKTIDGFKKIGDHVFTLNYQNDYGIDRLLKKGAKSTGGLLAFAFDYMHHARRNRVKRIKDGGFACSTFNAFTQDGDHIFARNFDYLKAPLLIVWTTPEGGYKSIAVANSTFMLFGNKNIFPMKKINAGRLLIAPYCCMEGMNEKGLSLAVLEIKTKATQQKTGKISLTTTSMIRAVLDKCASVDEAINMFLSYDMHDAFWCNYHYQITDSEGKSAIIEYLNNTISIIRSNAGETQRVTNFYITQGGDGKRAFGRARYEYIQSEVAKHGGVLKESGAMKILENCHLNYTHKRGYQVITLWSCVFNNTKKTLKLCGGLDYENVYNFSVDKPDEYFITKRETAEEITPFDFPHRDADNI